MKHLFLLIFVVVVSNNIYSQGCSDAGFCSIGSIKNSANSSSKNSLSFGAAFGIGEQSVFVTTPYLQYDLGLKNDFETPSIILYS